MKTTTSKVTTTTTTYTFTTNDIIEALAAIGKLPLSEVARIEHCHVRVPGGGDYSNMNLDLTEHPVVVVVKETVST